MDGHYLNHKIYKRCNNNCGGYFIISNLVECGSAHIILLILQLITSLSLAQADCLRRNLHQFVLIDI